MSWAWPIIKPTSRSQALEQHKLCLDAIQNGVVIDPNFKLLVYSNMANDYWALHDNEHAMSTYKSALELLPEVSSIERQAEIFWDGATRHTERGQYILANAAANKALSLYEVMENMRLVTRMENKYGDILLDMGDFEAAEGYLVRGLELADSLNSQVEKATVLTNLAQVSLKRNDAAEATERIEQAIALAREASEDGNTEDGEAEGGRPKGTARAKRVLARALALAGEIATQDKNIKKVDAHFNEAIRITEAGEDSEKSSDIYQRYAHVLASRGQHEQASKFYERAYKAVTRRY